MKIITLEELQEEFNSILSTVTEKENLINLELKEIDNYLNYTAPPRRHKMDFHFEPNTDAVFTLSVDLNRRKLLKRAFNGFNVYGKFELVDNKAKSQGMINLDDKVIEQASEFAKYFKWLKELDFKPNSAQDKSTLTISQKLLALHYLGLDLGKIENKKQSAKVLQQILNEDGDENIRKKLSNIYAGKNKIFTKNNLEITAKVFQDSNLTDIYLKIKEALNKIK